MIYWSQFLPNIKTIPSLLLWSVALWPLLLVRKYLCLKLLWDCLSEKRKPLSICKSALLLMIIYVRAKHAFCLHLYACKEIMPYFFAVGHRSHRRGSIVYLKTMEKLPNSLLNKLMNGEHVVHLIYLLSNEIWSDMAIETTYMKFEKVFN